MTINILYGQGCRYIKQTQTQGGYMSYGLILNHNVTAMSNLNALNRTNMALARVQEQLATGKRINSAKDDK